MLLYAVMLCIILLQVSRTHTIFRHDSKYNQDYLSLQLTTHQITQNQLQHVWQYLNDNILISQTSLSITVSHEGQSISQTSLSTTVSHEGQSMSQTSLSITVSHEGQSHRHHSLQQYHMKVNLTDITLYSTVT